MFTDMVGYTALIEMDERVGSTSAIDTCVRSIVTTTRSAGQIVQRLGDGSMSMFPSSLAAVQAAVEIQRELAAQDIPTRIGVHVGEVIVEPERLTGDAVNIAARIESFAVPGGVMLSDAAHDQIKNRSDVGAVAWARFRLKNVGRPFELFAVSTDGVVVPDPRSWRARANSSPACRATSRSPPAHWSAGPTSWRRSSSWRANIGSLTITGPGGVGKTRIVIEAGEAPRARVPGRRRVRPAGRRHRSGQFLARCSLPHWTSRRPRDERSARASLALIGDKKALLLLDNFEQVVAAGPEVARLVEACPSFGS